MSALQGAANPIGQFAHFERTSLDLVAADRVNQVIGTHQLQELAHVHFGDHHLGELAQLGGQIRRQWIQIAEMNMRDALALFPQLLDRFPNRAEGRPPPEHHQGSTLLVAEDLTRRNFARNPRNLAGSSAHH